MITAIILLGIHKQYNYCLSYLYIFWHKISNKSHGEKNQESVKNKELELLSKSFTHDIINYLFQTTYPAVRLRSDTFELITGFVRVKLNLLLFQKI